MPILRTESLTQSLRIDPDSRLALLIPILQWIQFKQPSSELVKLLQTSQPVQDSILFFANSQYFKHETPLKDLEEAEFALGIDKFAKLALLCVCLDKLTQRYRCYGMNQCEFFDISVSTAGAMELAVRHTTLNPLLGYALGLYHGLGRMILNDYLQTIRLKRILYAPQTAYFYLSGWERQHLGISHAEVAASLLASGGALEYFYRSVQFQDTPHNAGKHYAKIAALLNISLQVAAHLVMPNQNSIAIRSIPSKLYELSECPWQKLEGLQAHAQLELMRVHKICMGVT